MIEAKILNYFVEDNGDIYIQVSQDGRRAKISANGTDFNGKPTANDIEGYVNNLNFDINKLPKIEDASYPTQFLFRGVEQSSYNMFFLERDEFFYGDMGDKDDFVDKVLADVKKFHLENVITQEGDEAIFTCYGDLQCRFSYKF